jgi:hypothetical protein
MCAMDQTNIKQLVKRCLSLWKFVKWNIKKKCQNRLLEILQYRNLEYFMFKYK